MCDRIRSYVFTLNNYTDEEVSLITGGDYSYIVFGKEVGESGTPHLQGFVHFENAKTMTAVHKLKGWKRSALKPAECPRLAILYCKKGEQSHEEWEMFKETEPNYGAGAEVYEAGVFKQGKRSDLEKVYEEVKKGKSVDDVVWENPAVYQLCHKSLEKLEDIRLRKTFRTEMTEGIWIYGKTGTGKSKFAFKDFSNETHYVYPYDKGWCDGYKQQETVIFDEFRGQMSFNELLRMVDINPNFSFSRRCREPIPFTSKKVLITSSLPPSEVYHNLSENDKLDQLYRRFKIYELIDGEMILRDKDFFDNKLDA